MLPTIERGSVDAVVTDPPYGIGYRYDSGKEKTANPGDYWKWLKPIHMHCLRIARPGSLFAIWQAHKNFRYFWDWYGSDIKIYAAAKNFVQLLPGPLQVNGYDPVVMFWMEGAKPLKTETPKRSLNYFVANTANMKTRVETRGHPCPRPLDAVTEIVANFSVDAATILDPFTGSGTTGVACVQTGRRFIGIELDEGYFNIAKQRIQKAIAERDSGLFKETK